jgi:hypothetical protein
MIRLVVLLLCVGAFACLAISMARHQETLVGRALPAVQSRCLRGAGWCALAIALGFIVADQGWGVGLVAFSGMTSVAAAIVYGVLIIRERWSAAR